MKKWKVFIITHGPIIDSYYQEDPLFNNENYTFFNVSDEILKHKKYHIINKIEIKNYINLGKWYAEGEVIYNIYRNNLYVEYDYIGFIHWDYELKCEISFIGNRVTDLVNRCIEKNEKFISFETYPFYFDYAQNIMMDDSFPDQLTGAGINCYNQILKDYNDYYEDSVEIDFLMMKRINLCSAFLCEKSVFEELMPYYCWIIESKKLDNYDIEHKYRFQGGMMERYIGCFSHRLSMAEIPLFHRSASFITEKSSVNNVISNLAKKIKRNLTQLVKKHKA